MQQEPPFVVAVVDDDAGKVRAAGRPRTLVGEDLRVARKAQVQRLAGSPPAADGTTGVRKGVVVHAAGGVGAGAPMDLKDAARVAAPPPFAAEVLKSLTPGATLYVTDLPILPETTGPRLNVINADPPAKKSCRTAKS